MVRLKTALWISAHIRRCQGEGAFATIVRHGDDDAGAIAVKIWHPTRLASLYVRSLDEDANSVWRSVFDAQIAEADVDERIAREVKMDPDLWVLEIEGCNGSGYLDPII